jgi:hypothetical protein
VKILNLPTAELAYTTCITFSSVTPHRIECSVKLRLKPQKIVALFENIKIVDMELFYF